MARVEYAISFLKTTPPVRNAYMQLCGWGYAEDHGGGLRDIIREKMVYKGRLIHLIPCTGYISFNSSFPVHQGYKYIFYSNKSIQNTTPNVRNYSRSLLV